MTFQLEQFFQTCDWTAPFDKGVDGYEQDGWWMDNIGRVRDEPREHFYVLRLRGAEVARARIEVASHIYDGYQGEHAGEDWPHIAFVEVRSERRRQRIGREFVNQLRPLYGEVLWTQTEDSAEFWRAMGWAEYLPTGGEDEWWHVFVSVVVPTEEES